MDDLKVDQEWKTMSDDALFATLLGEVPCDMGDECPHADDGDHSPGCNLWIIRKLYDKHREALARIEELEALTQWRPIDDEAKDAGSVLLELPDGSVHEGFYGLSYESAIRGKGDDAKCWWTAGMEELSGDKAPVRYMPMPLPAPPDKESVALQDAWPNRNQPERRKRMSDEARIPRFYREKPAEDGGPAFPTEVVLTMPAARVLLDLVRGNPVSEAQRIYVRSRLSDVMLKARKDTSE